MSNKVQCNKRGQLTRLRFRSCSMFFWRLSWGQSRWIRNLRACAWLATPAIRPAQLQSGSAEKADLCSHAACQITPDCLYAQRRRNAAAWPKGAKAQRAGASKVALRRNPAGICSAEAPPNCLCAASNSSSRGSRIMVAEDRSAAASTCFTVSAAGVATANCVPVGDAPPCCTLSQEFQPTEATTASDASPASIFQRNTDALAACGTGPSAGTTCCTGTFSSRSASTGSCARRC